jgi:hypothetical protein
VTYSSSGSYSYSGEENLYAMSFDGVNDYIDYGDKDEFSINQSANNNGWGLSFWLSFDTGATASQQILNKQGYWSSGAYHYEYKHPYKFSVA